MSQQDTPRSVLSPADRLALVPVFDGDPLNFPLFWASYLKFIRRHEDLDDVEKYNILRMKLSPRVAEEHLLPLVGSNLTAVQIGLERYFASKTVVVERIKKYFEKRVSGVSEVEKLSELARLVVQFRRCYETMINFEEAERTFYFRLMLNKLPNRLKEEYFQTHGRVAPVKALIDFVSEQYDKLMTQRDDDFTARSNRGSRAQIGSERTPRQSSVPTNPTSSTTPATSTTNTLPRDQASVFEIGMRRLEQMADWTAAAAAANEVVSGSIPPQPSSTPNNTTTSGSTTTQTTTSTNLSPSDIQVVGFSREDITNVFGGLLVPLPDRGGSSSNNNNRRNRRNRNRR